MNVYVCLLTPPPAGNNMATAYVYDTRTGRQVTRVEAIRVQGCVKACGLSEDCRHLTMAVGHGYLFRFESKAPLLDKGSEEEEAGASGSDTGGQQQIIDNSYK
jgi:hypothetical protein